MTIDIHQGALGAAPADVGHTTKRFFPLYTGPASYVTGGDPGLLAAIGLGKIFAVLGILLTTGLAGSALYVGVYNPATDSIVIFNPTTGLEVAAATNLSTFTSTCEVIGQ